MKEIVDETLAGNWAIKLCKPEDMKKEIVKYLVTGMGRDPQLASTEEWYYAIARMCNEMLTRRRVKSGRKLNIASERRVYYLSMEYLPGRSLRRNLQALGLLESARLALKELGFDLEEIEEIEPDAGLGNGGLGRLADCFMDSLATHNYPASGYGMRYQFGLFKQLLKDNRQIEQPDNWLAKGNPWEVRRHSLTYTINFYGDLVYYNEDGKEKVKWIHGQPINAMAYDFPLAGHTTNTVSNLRLWSAHSSDSLHMEQFNEGNYIQAMEQKISQETISKVLYPNDQNQQGKELRLKQEYFFASASIQDIIGTYLRNHKNLDEIHKYTCIQLNDTHPAIAIPEFMYQLMDHHDYDFKDAWEICQQTFNYTNHTLMPEALEKWSVALLKKLLPRHLKIIYEINDHFLKSIRVRYPNRHEILSSVSLIDDQEQSVRMANLAIVASQKVNGVAKLHSELLKTRLFKDFDLIFPNKFTNATNGITPRRWILSANPELSKLYSQKLGSDTWINKLDELKKLNKYKDDPEFQEAFAKIKYNNKLKLAKYINKKFQLVIDPNSLIDTQVKRIHEYKRQLLNLLHIISRYNRIKANPNLPIQPRTFIFSGKAAPGYFLAKQIINIICDVATIVNNDPQVSQVMKVLFIPNYNVSKAEKIIPASELSEQISTAGTEASGTGNMKFALNGALTIGTLDGANIEIAQEVGKENMFIFGLNADEVSALKSSSYDPWHYYNENEELRQTIDMLRDGYFSQYNRDSHRAIYDSLMQWGDQYLVLADYADYILAQYKVDNLYNDKEKWNHKAIQNSLNIGFFSSDRSMEDYAKNIWRIQKRK